MDDLLARFEHLISEFENATSALDNVHSRSEKEYTLRYRELTAIDICKFLIEHDATVTFAAPPDTAPVATGHDDDSDYEWDIERRNWFKKTASADERDRLMGGV